MKTFIFTICYNCGTILNKALETFFEFHPDQIVHVFGTAKDFKALKNFRNNVEFIELSEDNTLKEYYKNGHLGTAYIVTKVLKGHYGSYSEIIHFDSDVIFRAECISDISTAFDNGYDLVGQRRSYEKNRCNRHDLIGLPDVIGTCFFGMKLDKITDYDFETLHRMVVGYYNPLNHPIMDFFDPVSFDVLKNGGKIFYLDFNEYGASNENGSWHNKFELLNHQFDFGEKFVHFAGIGSGMNFYYNGSGNVPTTYVEWAKSRFAMYMKLFYNEDLQFQFDKNTFNMLKEELHNLKNIKIFCSWELQFDLFYDRQIELYVDSIPTTEIPEGTIRFIYLNEPPEIYSVSEMALNFQHCYNYVLTHNQELLDAIPHSINFGCGHTWIHNYEFNEKKFETSTIVGSKIMTTNHELRHKLWHRQCEIITPTNFFQSMHNPILPALKGNLILREKKEPLFDSQFHIVIENVIRKNYFTEKLIDSLITKTVPVYMGCPNIGEWFNLEGMIIANNVDEIISKCNEFTPETYENMRPFIEENYLIAKNNFHNFPDRLTAVIKKTLAFD